MSRLQSNVARRSRARLDKVSMVLVVVFGVLAIATGVVAFMVVRNLVLGWSMTSLPGQPELAASQNTPAPGQTAAAGDLPAANLAPTPKPWDGKSRVTVLVMGLDYRDWEAGGDASRTDSMILLTIDPVSMSAGMLSIPRDLWVNIPGFDYGKINTAYFLGDSYKLPGGGPELAKKTVENFVGVPVNYYAVIDFNTFVKLIDEIGGIDINVPDRMVVDPLGPGNTITLYPGVQSMDGATALAYARNRYTDNGDFDRSQRQQQVILAIRDQILNFYTLPKLITKAPALYQELSAGIKTDMGLSEALQLATLASKVNMKKIKKGIIGPPKAVTFGTSPDGLFILIPVSDNVRLIRDQVFTTGGPVGPAAVAEDPKKLMGDEQARIQILNGTQTPDLAARTAELLKGQGLNVVDVSNADQVYQNSTVIIYNGKPYTIKYLADLLKVPTGRIFNRYNPDSQVDVTIILGNDWLQAAGQ